MEEAKPCWATSALVGKAYTAAGQAGVSLHTMVVLQAYQADLLRELDGGEGLSPDSVSELRRGTDLALCATKQTARYIGHSMAALVATERHLWLNLMGIKDRDKSFLLDAPISPQGLFCHQELKRQLAAFKEFNSRCSENPGLSSSLTCPPPDREEKKASVAHAPLPKYRKAGQRVRAQTHQMRPDLRMVISASVSKVDGARSCSHSPLKSIPPVCTCQCTVSGLLPGVSQWVLDTVKKGYRIQFATRPPSVLKSAAHYRRRTPNFVSPRRTSLPSEKRGRRICSPSRSGFGLLQPVFHCVKGGRGAASSSGPASSELYPKRLARTPEVPQVCFWGRSLPVSVLPFGLALSPCTFSKCMALATQCLQGIRVFNYLDDWLILAHSKAMAASHGEVVLAHMWSLGLKINPEKCVQPREDFCH
ncbi:hypothetical protein QTP70_016590 [Hemibagrus guttatus]|uniref:ribonuclease H n=1 Tax=Hemibagrus guttatus TaxID=175788 RepID=A0AAE0V908_9TELE|nr:hypothetical protein QTP70_016590 [Hemibagrus guttatus]